MNVDDARSGENGVQTRSTEESGVVSKTRELTNEFSSVLTNVTDSDVASANRRDSDSPQNQGGATRNESFDKSKLVTESSKPKICSDRHVRQESGAAENAAGGAGLDASGNAVSQFLIHRVTQKLVAGYLVVLSVLLEVVRDGMLRFKIILSKPMLSSSDVSMKHNSSHDTWCTGLGVESVRTGPSRETAPSWVFSKVDVNSSRAEGVDGDRNDSSDDDRYISEITRVISTEDLDMILRTLDLPGAAEVS